MLYHQMLNVNGSQKIFESPSTKHENYYDEDDVIQIQCSPANPAQAGEEAVGLADLSGLPSRLCVLVRE